ncbi:MAG: hypothetical protein M0P74_11900 [Syntrophales bacterium]|nr:hypothetical protein [Syntrophales bacterium]
MIFYQLAITHDLITSHAGLALLKAFAAGLGFSDTVDRKVSTDLLFDGEKAPYRTLNIREAPVFPLVFVTNGIRRLCEKIGCVPASDVVALRKIAKHSEDAGIYLSEFPVYGPTKDQISGEGCQCRGVLPREITVLLTLYNVPKPL